MPLHRHALPLLVALAALPACRAPEALPALPGDLFQQAQQRLDHGDSAAAIALLAHAPDTSVRAKIELASLLLQQHPARAYRLLDSAAALGSDQALYLAGYWGSLSRGPDTLAALAKVYEAARRGYTGAEHYLSIRFRQGGRLGTDAHVDSSLYWLKRASAEGDAWALADVRALPDSMKARFDRIEAAP